MRGSLDVCLLVLAAGAAASLGGCWMNCSRRPGGAPHVELGEVAPRSAEPAASETETAARVKPEAVPPRVRAHPTPERERPPPETDGPLVAEVDGEDVEIRSVRWLLQGDLIRLQLSTSDQSCGRGGPLPEVQLSFRHYGTPPNHRQTELYLSGTRVGLGGSLIYGRGVQHSIVFRYEPHLVPGTEVEAIVGFEGDVHGHSVRAHGHVVGRVCPRL